MAKPKTEEVSPEAEHATAIINKTTEELALLLSRNWADIGEMLKQEQEVSIATKIIITDRKAEAGTQSDKDSRIKVAISFSKKFSDSCEADLPDPNQLEIPGV